MSSNQDGWIEWTDTKGEMGRRFEWQLWLWWVLATGLSASLALIVINWLVFLSVAGDAEISLSDDNAIGPLLLFACGLLFVGPLVGVAQGLALRFAGRSTGWTTWIIADTVGVVMAIVATVFLGVLTAGNNANGWIWIVVPGAVLGIAQQLVLSSSTRRAVWWIPISWGSWLIAVLIGAFVGSLVKNLVRDAFHIRTQTQFDYPFYPIESAISWSIGLLIGVFVFSAMTGFGLVWLFQRPQNAASDSSK